MSEENPIPENSPETPNFLGHIKQITMERFISHLNGVGAGIVSSYPMAEVQSWTIQRNEAESVLPLVEPASTTVLQLAPFLKEVVLAQYGLEEDEAVLAGLVLAKAGEVKANADRWAAIAAYVNGLRARVLLLLDAAETTETVLTIESEAQTELSNFRTLYEV